MTQSKTPFIVVLSLAYDHDAGPVFHGYVPAGFSGYWRIAGSFSAGGIAERFGIRIRDGIWSVNRRCAFRPLRAAAGVDERPGDFCALKHCHWYGGFLEHAARRASCSRLLALALLWVSVPALVRDRVAGRDAAKLFSMMGFIMVLAPGIAPSVGSAILALGSWHYIFFALAVYAVLLVPLLVRVLFTGTGKVSRAKSPKMSLLARYKLVLSTKPALPFIVWQAASFSTLMMFITYASFIYQGHFGQSPSSFSMLFAANIVAMLIFNILNRVLLSRLSSLRILQLATGCQGVGILLLVMAAFMEWPLYAFLPAMMLTIGAVGAISPNIQACFLEYFPTSGGTAAALLGAAQFGVAGLLSALSAMLPHTLEAVILAMAGFCGSVAYLMLARSIIKGRAAVEEELSQNGT